MQVVEQAITATGGLDDARLADYTRGASFSTVVGTVKFGEGGEWDQPRVVQVQFQNVSGSGAEQFKSTRTQVVVAPSEYVSGDFIYPYPAGTARAAG
jgi:branched-chain amino acid transport system substrate-binding protein